MTDHTSAKLERLDAQLDIARGLVDQARAEMEKDEPVIAHDGVIVASGEDARSMLRHALDIHQSLEEIAAMLRKKLSH